MLLALGMTFFLLFNESHAGSFLSSEHLHWLLIKSTSETSLPPTVILISAQMGTHELYERESDWSCYRQFRVCVCVCVCVPMYFRLCDHCKR